ncbi:MAG: zinc ABC transporter substrate-binding protein [Chloroflexales bacterium]|nr:zinc ABC transporter substrate-binding protein [Chloroflexales bacterium]
MITPIIRHLNTLSLVALLALLLAACGAQPTAQSEPTAAPATPTVAPAAPTEAPVAPAAPTVASTEPPIAVSEPLKVVATYSILGDLVQNVVGDSGLIELTVLVSPGGDAHTYEPTPRDSAALAEADILFENGLEFESWIDDLYAASGSTATRVAMADGISDLISSDGHNHDEEDPVAHACEYFEDDPEAVTADASGATPTATIPADHTHYIVTLADGAGTVSLSREEDAEVSFFLGSDVPFTVSQADAEVEPELVEPVADACAAIAIVYTYDLAPGDYVISFGSGADASVALVWEEAGHSEGEEHSHEEGEEHGEGEVHGEGEEHAEGEEHGHSHGEYDPHVWHDPNNAMVMVEAIRNTLVGADPSNADTYALNADAYLAELQALDAFIVEAVAQLPAERRKLVTSHDTFGYFARQYGFEIVGTALGSVTTEAADPSAGEIAELVESIQAVEVPAIFAENIANPALMETIAREAGVELAPTLYTDALGEPGSAGATYLEMVRHNVNTMVTALGV